MSSLWKSAAHHASSLHGSSSWATAKVVASSSEEKSLSHYLLDEANNKESGSSSYSTPPHTPRLLQRAASIPASSSDPISPLPSRRIHNESNLSSLEAWDYSVELDYLRGGTDDLQLAAELGKTLLERNKELENVMKRQQSMVEDQTHEIEYLTKQNLALREVNESRLKVYEQLEVSINDLEDSNRKLVEESKSDKVRIKSLTLTNDRLESRLEELQRSLEESTHDHSILPPEKDLGGGRRRSSDSSGSSSYSTKSSKSSASEKFWEVGDELILAQEPSVLEEEEADPKDGTELDVSSFEEEASSPSKGSSSEALSRLGSNSPASSGYSSDQPYPTYPTRNVSRPRPKSEILESCSDLMNPWRINSPKTSEVKISELEKAFAHLDSENALLKEEIQRSKQTRDSDTVQDEVLKIHDVKVGKLCRRCLGSIESPLAQGLKSIKSVVQQVHSDFIQEKMASSINEDEIRSKDPSIPHFPAPHKYASSGAHSFSSSMSIQDELLLSSGGLSNESGYASMTGSRKDSSTSSNSTLSSYSIRRESFGRRMSRKDSSLSTWSSPEYDVAPSEIHGGSTLFWSMSPYSSLLLQPKEILNIPEETAGLEERNEPPHPQKGEPSLNNKYHQNYKDIFKEIFAILRKAQY